MRPNVFLRIISKLGATGYGKWVKTYLVYANVEWPFENFVALAFLYSLGIAFNIFTIIFLVLFLGFSLIVAYLASLAIFLLSFTVFHLYLVMTADKRAKAADEALPDMLRLMALNLRSGMTTDRALLLSARPEFGIMEDEIKSVAKKVISGSSVEDALQNILKRINSKTLDRTIKLIVEGLKKGGALATLLEQLSDDIVHVKTLKKEIAAQVGMYAMFILFAAGIGAPLLYSVSTFLIQTMTKITSTLNVQNAPAAQSQLGAIQFKRINVDVNLLVGYEVAALMITAVFGGLLMGLLREGNEKAGIRFIPILLILNFTVFFAIRLLLANVIQV